MFSSGLLHAYPWYPGDVTPLESKCRCFEGAEVESSLRFSREEDVGTDGLCQAPAICSSFWELACPLAFLSGHLFQEVPRTGSPPCNDFTAGMNRCGPFPPSQTGLLGSQPDVFSQLGKGEDWMLEDASGGLCLGKSPACGRHREGLHKYSRPVDCETTSFPFSFTAVSDGHTGPRVHVGPPLPGFSSPFFSIDS